MIKGLIDELVNYIESYAYIDVLERLNAEADIKTRYDSRLVDEVEYAIRKAISYNPDALRISVLNDCCDAFEIDDEARAEVEGRLSGRYSRK